jgi:hypothetical protein
MKDVITLGGKYGPAMEIKTQEEADKYFEECVQHMMRRKPCGRQEAEEIERCNLGYYAGYYSNETRERVERLFRCSHPIFGSIGKSAPSPSDALQAGIEAGVRSQHN